MNNEIYKVTAIQEDLDFGCEERSGDSPVMAVVILQGADGSEKMTRCCMTGILMKEIW